jgi:hypothetical protein
LLPKVHNLLIINSTSYFVLEKLVKRLENLKIMHPEILCYYEKQRPGDQAICFLLANTIDEALPNAERKI